MGRSHQQSGDSVRKHKEADPIAFTDGMITAESLDNAILGNEQGGPAPAIPEPSGWLVMGLGLLIVGPYARSRCQPQR